jgi:hypothetical protein
VAALVVGLTTGVAAGTVTGTGAGTTLLAFAVAALAGRFEPIVCEVASVHHA